MSNANNTLEYITENALNNKDFIAECETRFNNKVKTVAKEIAESERVEIVMLAGPSSSGKTTTAKKLCRELEKLGVVSHTISLDDFYLNNCDAPRFPDGTPDFETVDALDKAFFQKTMSDLIKNGEAYLPEFDFKSGTRKKQLNRLVVGKNDVVIVEGLHALNPVITDNLPADRLLKIYISISSRIYSGRDIVLNKRNMRFIRRVVRDYKFRGNSVEKTFKMWITVRYGEDQYLFPYKDNADIKINTIHLYETCVFKDIAIELLKELPKESEFYKESQRLIRSLMKFPALDTKQVPENSLLREFLG
ncbi:MAG: nucleoside kinase [Oscillospiraceae bacterium]|nr:nucleoside kinase [Oscillospiraceae bacterium]